MKHCIASRFKFDEDNFERMSGYVEICNEILVPSLNSQVNKNFDWLIYTNPKHDDWIKERITGYPYRIIHDLNVELTAYNIQTRHDIDDWMHPNYVESIQKTIERCKYDICLLHVNLILADYKTRQTMFYPAWNSRETSQFLTLYLKDNWDTTLYVYMDEHTKMTNYVKDVIELPLGLTMQIRHDGNISGYDEKKIKQ